MATKMQFFPGKIAKEPTIRDYTRRDGSAGRVLSLSVLCGHEPPDTPGDRPKGKFLDVNVWDNVDNLDGLLEKGDAVIVTGDEVKMREYNGKTYPQMSATGLFVGADVVFRWMQQLAGSIGELQEQLNYLAEQAGKAADDTPEPSGEMYPGEVLNDYAPERSAPQSAGDIGEAPISDSDDLPF